jgi:hypothetical protein
MTKEQVIFLRKELHHLSQPDRDQVEKDKDGNETENITINIPLVIRINTSYLIDEMTSCVIWDDNNELIYAFETNNEPSGPLNQICPMYVRVYPYSSIEQISARLDKNCSMNFLNGKKDLGLTTQATCDRYAEQISKIYDDRSYIMGQPSTTTEKRSLKPDDVILNKEAYKTL